MNLKLEKRNKCNCTGIRSLIMILVYSTVKLIVPGWGLGRLCCRPFGVWSPQPGTKWPSPFARLCIRRWRGCWAIRKTWHEPLSPAAWEHCVAGSPPNNSTTASPTTCSVSIKQFRVWATIKGQKLSLFQDLKWRSEIYYRLN